MKLNLPNLIIIGVHKSGTTSLFMYLKIHPDIFGASKKEIHYFTPLRFGRPLKSIHHYAKFLKNHAGEKYALEASPSYFYGGNDIIDAMKETLPKEHKVILMLREPSSRFVSFYKHLKSKLILDKSETIAHFLKKSIQHIGKPIEETNPYSRAIQEGFYINYIQQWMNNYGENMKIVHFEDLRDNAKCLMIDIVNWLNIDSKFYEELNFTVENKTVFAKNKILHKTALLLNESFESILRNNPNIKKRIRDFYYRFNESKEEETFDAYIMNELHKIYKEPNLKLKELLIEKGFKYPSWI